MWGVGGGWVRLAKRSGLLGNRDGLSRRRAAGRRGPPRTRTKGEVVPLLWVNQDLLVCRGAGRQRLCASAARRASRATAPPPGAPRPPRPCCRHICRPSPDSGSYRSTRCLNTSPARLVHEDDDHAGHHVHEPRQDIGLQALLLRRVQRRHGHPSRPQAGALTPPLPIGPDRGSAGGPDRDWDPRSHSLRIVCVAWLYVVQWTVWWQVHCAHCADVRNRAAPPAAKIASTPEPSCTLTDQGATQLNMHA